MKQKQKQVFLLLSSLLFAGISCSYVQDRIIKDLWYQFAPEDEHVAQYNSLYTMEAEYFLEKTPPLLRTPRSENCDAFEYIETETKLVSKLTNEFKTVDSQYSLDYRNTHPNLTIFLYAFEHRADIHEKTESNEWTLIDTLEPGEGDTRSIYIVEYNEKDAQGTSMYMIEKLAGLYDTPECVKWKGKSEYLGKTAQYVRYYQE
jgi:hypothetical protein